VPSVAAQRDCRKTLFRGAKRPEGVQRASLAAGYRLLERPQSLNFADITRLREQREQAPLYIHLRFAA